MRWLADKVFWGHSLATVLGLAWAWMMASVGLAVVFGVLWLANFILYQEWRHDV